MTLRLHASAAVAIAGALVACASSPEPSYYALAPASGLALQAPLGAIEVRQPSVARYLDRSEIVAQVADHRLRLASNERWSEPLGQMIGRILAADLSERLPSSIVFTEASDLSIQPSSVVELAIGKFDLDADGVVRLKAVLAVRSGSGQVAALARPIALQARPETSGTNGLVTTMSGLLGRLADEVAVALKTRAASEQAFAR
jgi:uncharacterized protein